MHSSSYVLHIKVPDNLQDNAVFIRSYEDKDKDTFIAPRDLLGQ